MFRCLIVKLKEPGGQRWAANRVAPGCSTQLLLGVPVKREPPHVVLTDPIELDSASQPLQSEKMTLEVLRKRGSIYPQRNLNYVIKSCLFTFRLSYILTDDDFTTGTSSGKDGGEEKEERSWLIKIKPACGSREHVHTLRTFHASVVVWYARGDPRMRVLLLPLKKWALS